MTRRLLAMIMSLGLVVTAVGFTGIFAVLGDRAKTGDFIVNSGPRPVAADLQIASTGQLGVCSGYPFSDDLDGTTFSAGFVQPTGGESGVPLCLWNAGTSALEVHVVATDVTDVDVDCTNDETDAGDTTCGEDGQGELASLIDVKMQTVECDGFELTTLGTASVADLAAYQPQAGQFEAWDLGVLDPNEVVCLRIVPIYPAIGDGTTEVEAQLAQSDTLTWRIAFDGTVP